MTTEYDTGHGLVMHHLNPIIPSDPMRFAVTKTSETCTTPVGWETEAEWALEQRAFQWSPNWSEDETRTLINDLWRQYCFAAEPKAGVNGSTDATPAPEPQPEVAAEPVAWVEQSPGFHLATIQHDSFSLIEVVKRDGKPALELTIHSGNVDTGRWDDLSITLTPAEAAKVAATMAAVQS